MVRGRPGLGAAAGRAGLAEASWGGGAAPPRAEASTRKDSASAPKIQSERVATRRPGEGVRPRLCMSYQGESAVGGGAGKMLEVLVLKVSEREVPGPGR